MNNCGLVIGFDSGGLSRTLKTFLWILLMGALIFSTLFATSLITLQWLAVSVLIFGFMLALLVLLKILSIFVN